MVLENSRGDTISDAKLLRRLRTLNRTGSFYKAILKQVTPIAARFPNSAGDAVGALP
jgi:hypothetical protein